MVESMEKDGASEDQIAKVRMTPASKQKLLTEFSSKRRADNNQIVEESKQSVSVNHDMGVDTGTLLTGDSNEELRMQGTL